MATYLDNVSDEMRAEMRNIIAANGDVPVSWEPIREADGPGRWRVAGYVLHGRRITVRATLDLTPVSVGVTHSLEWAPGEWSRLEWSP